MSVLGKRKRKDIDIESKEEKEEFSTSPPKKRLKSLHITDRKRIDDKQENDMDVDTEQKSMEIVDTKHHDQSKDTSSSTSKDQICSFSMDAVINNEFKTITDTDLKGIEYDIHALYFDACFCVIIRCMEYYLFLST